MRLIFCASDTVYCITALKKQHGGERESWKSSSKLEEDLKKYVAANMQRLEILDFMKKNYCIYKWSLRTLDRRLRHFGINYIDRDVPLDVAREAVRKELDGPGVMLGY